MGAHHPNGYGGFRVGKKSWKAHRFAWVIVYGDIPDGEVVCHKCDNRKCVNYHHLFAGTQKENIQDRIVKGRSRYAVGECHGNSKLRTQEVAEIKHLLNLGNLNQRQIAKRFGISYKLVNQISRGQTWGWLNESSQ